MKTSTFFQRTGAKPLNFTNLNLKTTLKEGKEYEKEQENINNLSKFY
jgi:hypothetical protein